MRYRFDDFILDTAGFEITRNGEVLHTEPQVVELLSLLVENNQRMVSKEEINEVVWRGRIVSDAALSSRIKMARAILGDDGKTQRYIRTVHKKGFRFVGDVQAEVDKPAAQATAKSTERNSSNPCVMVVPFLNMAADDQQDYFTDGISADIISQLSRHHWLKVIARNTSFGFKNKSIDIRQIGEELGLDYAVEGSVQRAGDQVRVIVSLVDASSGLQVWSDRFRRDDKDLFALQDEITEKIVARLEPEIGFAERNKVVHLHPTNLKAWDCYHLGVHHFFRFTAEDNRLAQQLLKQSCELDPEFGDAYVWWAYAVVLGMVYWDTPETRDLLDQALEACNKALEIDSQNATYYALRGRVQLARCEYQSAIRDNEVAISLNTTFAAAHCGLADSLAYEARYEEAINCFEKAIDLSPNDPQAWAFLTYGGLAQIFSGNYDQALAWLQRASTIPNCQYWTTAHQVVAHALKGELQQAKSVAAALLRDQPQFNLEFAKRKLFYLKEPSQIELYLSGLEKAGIS